MTPEQAEAYHANQIETFSETDADLVTAMTMTYSDEALGMTRAAHTVGIPIVISFTVDTDDRLPTGRDLRDAIAYVDDATAGAPAYFMISCAYPTHFSNVLEADTSWTNRTKGIRLNASWAC